MTCYTGVKATENRGDVMLTRRECLLAGSAAVLVPTTPGKSAESARIPDPASPLPHKDAFFPFANTYLNCASQHPVSRGARRALDRYLDYKTFATDSDYSNGAVYNRNLENYAQLINADVDEVAYVQSTTVGENLILKALNIPEGGGRIVTDDLHYLGSLPTYAELIKHGMDVITLRAEDGRIELEAFEKAINADTRLVSISSVSMVNGFQHDLRQICEMAHARGALVYADVVHQVGSTPLDVRETNVDFCSAASYKWLMGEQGLGFLYARKDRLAEIKRPWFGHYQLKQRHGLGFPSPVRHDEVVEYEHHESALGLFAMGSQPNIIAAQLDYSLQYLLDVGVERIQLYRQPLIDRLQERLPQLGYASITPRDSATALVSFRHDGDTQQLHDKLDAAKITLSVAEHHFRISPSVFNDMDDIDKLIEALS
ncbi:MAG: aminotransferase [Gammaproteobacteria bacterium]|nr:MAG: aminotransferase [Gammaproteobacteria bacterium]